MIELNVYVCAPVDSWCGWRYLGGRRTKPSKECCAAAKSLSGLLLLLGWHGDGAWFVSSALNTENPASLRSTPIFAVKQDQKGRTFIVSEAKIDPLERLEGIEVWRPLIEDESWLSAIDSAQCLEES